jgi:hypothetical protein
MESHEGNCPPTGCGETFPFGNLASRIKSFLDPRKAQSDREFRRIAGSGTLDPLLFTVDPLSGKA